MIQILKADYVNINKKNLKTNGVFKNQNVILKNFW